MKYEFDGISTEQFNPQDRELFTEYYDGTLIEKDNFTVELDSKEVKLHLYIEIIWSSVSSNSDMSICSI